MLAKVKKVHLPKNLRKYALLKTTYTIAVLFPLFMVINFISAKEIDLHFALPKVIIGFLLLASFLYTFYCKNIQREIKYKSFEALFHNELIFAFSIDSKGIINNVNKKMESYFGIERSFLIGKNISVFFTERDYKINKEAFECCLKGNTKQIETSVIDSDGHAFDVELMAVPVVVNNKVEEIIGMFHDISERNKLQSELESLANQDGLTGVANRRMFDKTLDLEWKKAKVQKHSISLVIVDIDHFKKYNDLYGHLKGDTCLKTIATILYDSISKDMGTVARFGGEEFVLVLPKTKRTDAVLIAESIRANIEAYGFPHQASNIGDCVTISIGVAGFVPNPEQKPEMLLHMADQALYQAKADGGNQVCIGGRQAKTTVI